MNLNQLYQLKHDISLNRNKVVSKNTVLAILDSHIQAIQGQDDQIPKHDGQKPQKVTQSLGMVMPRIEQVRHPPSREVVKKAYGG